MNKVQKITVTTVAAITLFTGGVFTAKAVESKRWNEQTTITEKKKVFAKDSVVKEINSISELHVLEAIVVKDMKIVDKKLLGSKEQTIQFKAKLRYWIDWGKIKAANFSIIEEDNTVVLSVPTPRTTLHFVEESTEASNTKTTGFAFGDITLAVGDYEGMKIDARKAMLKENKDKHMAAAQRSAIKELEFIHNKVSNEGYKLKVQFVEGLE